MGATYIGEVYRTEQGIFCVDPVDKFVAKTLIEEGRYGTLQLEQIKMFCSPSSSVLLLGAHIGAIAVPLSKMVGEMTVFEANPRTFELLRANLKLNDCLNVEAYNLAANDSNEALKFVLNTVNSGGSKRFPVHQDATYFFDAPQIAEVPGVRLDDHLAGRKYDLIFMDIEGSEVFAMRGMPGLMAQAQVVFSEFIPHHLSRVGGVGVEQFIACFEGYQTMIVPSIPRACHGAEIGQVLHEMFAKGQPDDGLIFIREHIDIMLK